MSLCRLPARSQERARAGRCPFASTSPSFLGHRGRAEARRAPRQVAVSRAAGRGCREAAGPGGLAARAKPRSAALGASPPTPARRGCVRQRGRSRTARRVCPRRDRGRASRGGTGPPYRLTSRNRQAELFNMDSSIKKCFKNSRFTLDGAAGALVLPAAPLRLPWCFWSNF